MCDAGGQEEAITKPCTRDPLRYTHRAGPNSAEHPSLSLSTFAAQGGCTRPLLP